MCGSIIVIVVIAIVIISNIGRCNHHHELNFKIPQFSSPTAKSLIKDVSGNHWHGGACNARQVERWIGMQWWCALVPASELASPPFWQSSNSQRQRLASAWRAGHPFTRLNTFTITFTIRLQQHSPNRLVDRFSKYRLPWMARHLSFLINRLLVCFHLKEFQFNR